MVSNSFCSWTRGRLCVAVATGVTSVSVLGGSAVPPHAVSTSTVRNRFMEHAILSLRRSVVHKYRSGVFPTRHVRTEIQAAATGALARRAVVRCAEGFFAGQTVHHELIVARRRTDEPAVRGLVV